MSKEPLTNVTVSLDNGNAFAIIGKVSKALRRAGHEELVAKYKEEATSGDYDHLIQVTMKYVSVE